LAPIESLAEFSAMDGSQQGHRSKHKCRCRNERIQDFRYDIGRNKGFARVSPPIIRPNLYGLGGVFYQGVFFRCRRGFGELLLIIARLLQAPWSDRGGQSGG
jgi:hypothetical protein